MTLVHLAGAIGGHPYRGPGRHLAKLGFRRVGAHIDGIGQGEGVDRRLAGHHAARLPDPAHDDAVRGGDQAGVVQGGLGLVAVGDGGGEAGLGGADVLGARALPQQGVGLLGHEEAGDCFVVIRVDLVQFLLTGKGGGGQLLLPFEFGGQPLLQGREEVYLRLGAPDLLRPIAATQLLEFGLGAPIGRVGGGQGIAIGARVQFGEQVALVNPGALLVHQGLQASRLPERQLDLADIHITVEGQVGVTLAGPPPDPPGEGDEGDQDDEGQDSE